MTGVKRKPKSLPPERICDHCGMDLVARNPSGYCDHLYYPDCCEVCKKNHPSEWDKMKTENARLKAMFDFICINYYKKLNEEPRIAQLKPLDDFIEHQKKLFEDKEKE